MKKKLGKSFEALLENTSIEDLAQDDVNLDGTLNKIPIEKIEVNPHQPRKIFTESALSELALSIQAQGLLQPITVRKHGDKYQIISGERRWRAAQRIPLHTIDAIVKDVSDEKSSVLALIENLQREDLSPLELANGMKSLLDSFSLTHQQVADALGKSRASVTNLLRILQLSKSVQALLSGGAIEFGHAKLLITRTDEEQAIFTSAIIKQQLSVRAAEKFIAEYDIGNDEHKNNIKNKQDKQAKNTYIERLEERLGAYLGDRVCIEDKDGTGKITFFYDSLDKFDSMMTKLNIPKELLDDS